MSPSEILSVDIVVACIGPGEHCTRAELMHRVGMGMATVQYILNAGVSSGRLRQSRERGHHVWWIPPSNLRAVPAPHAVLQGYDHALREFAELCTAARPAPPPGQVIRYGVGWQ